MTGRYRRVTLIFAGAAIGLTGCGDRREVSMEGKTLYARLGGDVGIRPIVHDFVGRAAANSKVNFTRAGTGMEWRPTPENTARVEERLVQYISLATMGPNYYQGRDMKSVHRGMKITNAEFDAAAADLEASLDLYKVPKREKDELMKIVETTRKDIVEQ